MKAACGSVVCLKRCALGSSTAGGMRSAPKLSSFRRSLEISKEPLAASLNVALSFVLKVNRHLKSM